MKKILSLVLSLVLLLSFAACSPENTDVSSEPATQHEIEALAAKGKLGNLDFELGTEPKEVRTYFEKLAQDYKDNHQDDDTHNHDFGASADGEDDYAYYYLHDEEKYNMIETANARYYYGGFKQELGIMAIATDSEICGFKPGITLKYEVEEAISIEGETFNADEDDLELLYMPPTDVSVLKYDFENYQLCFFFYDNTLITTALINTDTWVHA